MTDDEREYYADAKTFAWAAPVILPLIEKRRKVAFSRLMAQFKTGETNNIALIAELNVLTDLEREINQKEQEYRTMEETYASRK